MTMIPAGWWLVGGGTPPVPQELPPLGFVVVAVVLAIATALALRSAWRVASRGR
jgi:hypothetical protein